MKLSDLSVRNKLLLLVVFSASLLLAACLYNLNEQRKNALSEREAKLSAQVEVATSLINYYYQQRDILGEQGAKQRALEALRSLRYDTNNYFWVLTPELKILLHPRKPTLEGADASQIKDGAGKLHWRQMATIANSQQAGFLDYQWKSPQGELKDKISYIALFPEWQWIVGSGLFVADIKEDLIADIIKESVVAFSLIFALAVLGYFISNNIVSFLNQLSAFTGEVANGDLTVRQHAKRKDELGEVSRELDRMLNKLQSTLQAAHESALQSSVMAQNIAQASEESASSVNNQHSQLEQLSTSMTEMSTTISDVASNAENTSHSTSLVTSHAEKSGQDMHQTAQTIAEVSQDIATADQMVSELQAGVNEIRAVVSVIRDVSEQTNLLALNAAIEAARAGDQGRGFAVVADEVRNLASRTQKSTDEVQKTIDSLIEQTERTVRAMERSNLKVEVSVDISRSTQAQLETMVSELLHSNDMVAQIAAASEQQGLVAQEMSQNVSTIHLAANEVKQTSQRLAEESQHLAATSEILHDQLKYFKV